MSICKMCKERGQSWAGDPLKCAFVDDNSFLDSNWNCATVNAIRDIAERNYQYNDDQKQSLIPTEVSGAESLWVTWYKNRGRTEAMWLLFSDRDPLRPTEHELLEILKEQA